MSTGLRILGIDPGSRITGFGIVDLVDNRPKYVASGGVQTVAGDFPQRLKLIFESIARIAAEYQPQVLAIESIFVHKNAGSALKLGHARSAAICATFALDIPVFEYAPREIKLAVVGSGSASKEQVQHMIVSLLELDGTPSPDAADALATAVCHGHRRGVQSRLDHAAALAATASRS